ncbi:hypothetical protein AB0M28_16210 [Streptomyces sp. NPDC051940]|uniref:hypothetical protein n=1 Tax=Streptomyces sp. NPDC051940 TaxID=3155675 RepID=UPI00342B6EA0
MTLALMWEAKAAAGRADELLEWARAQALTEMPARRETMTAPGERVLVITWWEGSYDTKAPELPDPPAELCARPVHRWRFESVAVEGGRTHVWSDGRHTQV